MPAITSLSDGRMRLLCCHSIMVSRRRLRWNSGSVVAACRWTFAVACGILPPSGRYLLCTSRRLSAALRVFFCAPLLSLPPRCCHRFASLISSFCIPGAARHCARAVRCSIPFRCWRVCAAGFGTV